MSDPLTEFIKALLMTIGLVTTVALVSCGLAFLVSWAITVASKTKD